MIVVTDIQATDWSVALGDYGNVVTYVDDIAQCINIILGTPKGSDPLRPEFGSDLWKYIDHPFDRALPHLVRESIDAIATWEPRVEIISVMPSIGDTLGSVIILIEWRLSLGAPSQTTQVVL